MVDLHCCHANAGAKDCYDDNASPGSVRVIRTEGIGVTTIPWAGPDRAVLLGRHLGLAEATSTGAHLRLDPNLGSVTPPKLRALVFAENPKQDRENQIFGDFQMKRR